MGCVDNALGYTTLNDDGSFASSVLTDAGRIIRNLIHGADTVMSHAPYTYHLAALDYIDASHLNHPWKPSVPASDMLDGSTGVGAALVGSYVAALSARRKAHTMSALLSGRHPIQNAIVPGGVTTLLDATHGAVAISQFKVLLDDIREFINATYIPDVLTVAYAYGTGGIGIKDYWNFGTGYGNLLAYGDFDIDGNGRLLLKRGRVHLAGGPARYTLDQRNIVEYIGYSHYQDYLGGPGIGKHPWDGETRPMFEKTNALGTSYSWQKAPRISASGGEAKPGGGTYAAGDPIPYEVGPLARMVNSYLDADQPTVSEAGLTRTIPTLGLGTYSCDDLVNAALSLAGVTVTNLWSVLGRHAARALECKLIADAMAGWITELEGMMPNPQVYTYIKIPKGLKKGVGLCEAPRGALGHWIKIEKKRILKYQCVVPSTWNISPRDDIGQLGPAEYTLRTAGSLGTSTADIVINILRIVHTWDFCSACSIHVITPDKKKVATIHMDTDGSVRVEQIA